MATEQFGDWVTALTDHDGLMVALRARSVEKSDPLRVKFTYLVIVKHHLGRVNAGGLPEPAYNESLKEFDHEVVGSFFDMKGMAVIVETCSGKRVYYGYSEDVAGAEGVFGLLKQRHTQHKLEFLIKSDPSWKFYDTYRSRFGW